jgi:hypothetical protein
MMLTYSLAAARWEQDGYGAMLSVPSLHLGLLAACHPWSPTGYKEKLMNMQGGEYAMRCLCVCVFRQRFN